MSNCGPFRVSEEGKLYRLTPPNKFQACEDCDYLDECKQEAKIKDREE